MRTSQHYLPGWGTAILLAITLIAIAPAAVAQVNVTVNITGTPVPGGSVTASAMVEITDGSTLQSYAWSQTGGVPAMLAGANTQNATVMLGQLATYKDHLFEILAEPPIGPDDLPPNVPPPDGEFPGGLQNRFQVVGLNPFTLEETGLVSVEVQVITTSGTYTGTGAIHTTLPWKVTTGLRNVPVGIPVVLQGKDQATYDWALTSKPGGSGATLMDPATRNPVFTPDVTGLYEVEVVNTATNEVVSLPIYAGTWRGIITGQDGNGRPNVDGSCNTCHNGIVGDWKETGHAEIFTDNLNTNSHYSSNCFSCHTIGFDPEVVNGGVDEAPDYMDFFNSGLIANPSPDNWTTVLNNYPATAQKANVQCESCHGPQGPGIGGDAHGLNNPMGDPRKTLSADVCATCHGEPLRHARYQQWQLSGHANYELAIDEGDSGNCSRCHTVNGFLEWLPILLDNDPNTDPLANITVDWDTDEIHPQTCQTCHDPHDSGNISGDNTNAPVRISGDTPPLIAGFQVLDVGRGAICMTCHNTRRGLRNDTVYADYAGTSEQVRAPHPGAQTDVLVGQNAYLGAVGLRGSHSFLENTCVTCHMEATPPPADLSYNLSGTNHTFFARNDICADCHTGLTADVIQGPVEMKLEELKGLLEQAHLDLLRAQVNAGNTIDLDGDATITSPADVVSVEFDESRGSQALTVTLMGGMSFGPISMGNINVVPAMGSPARYYTVMNDALSKAGWNWALISADGSKGVHNPNFVNQVLDNAIGALQGETQPCVEDQNTICLRSGRFQVSVDWQRPPDFPGLRPALVSNLRTSDSGIFYFQNPNNLEFLLKIVNGCSLNNNYWVFFAATTDVEFTVTVVDTQNGMQKVYTNPLGQPADAVTDTAAFATCP